jgi:heme-degrading monooxygenase HmoA
VTYGAIGNWAVAGDRPLSYVRRPSSNWSNLVSQILTLPEPPYFAVIAPAALVDDVSGYVAAAPSVMAAAAEVDGFLGIEVCGQPGFSIAVTYWGSLEAIEVWRRHPVHVDAKHRGRTEWFTGYATRIAQVLHQY